LHRLKISNGISPVARRPVMGNFFEHCAICILGSVPIIAVARRDPATAAAGVLGALILGILAILSGEKDNRYDC
jgi:hypothetical protein